MKRRLCLYLAAVGVLTAASSPEPAPAQEFVVIVNASNPVASMSKEEVAKLFLKKTVSWPAGTTVAAVEQPMTAKTREAFAREVLGKTIAQVKSYWQQQIFSGRDVPLPEKQNDDDVVAFVRSNPNGIGYVAKGVEVGRGVKIISIAP